MWKLSMEYWNELAQQMLLISALLSGFSIAVVASLLVFTSKHPIINRILKTATIAAGSFLVTVFAMTRIIMMTTTGYPNKVVEADLLLPRIVGISTLFVGIISLSIVISLSGWTNSKSTGVFTTVIGVLTFLGIITMLF